MATLTEDVRTLSQAVAAIPSVCIDVATIVGCLTYLAIISPTIFAGRWLPRCCRSCASNCSPPGSGNCTGRPARPTTNCCAVRFGHHGIKELKMHRDRAPTS